MFGHCHRGVHLGQTLFLTLSLEAQQLKFMHSISKVSRNSEFAILKQEQMQNCGKVNEMHAIFCTGNEQAYATKPADRQFVHGRECTSYL